MMSWSVVRVLGDLGLQVSGIGRYDSERWFGWDRFGDPGLLS